MNSFAQSTTEVDGVTYYLVTAEQRDHLLQVSEDLKAEQEYTAMLEEELAYRDTLEIGLVSHVLQLEESLSTSLLRYNAMRELAMTETRRADSAIELSEAWKKKARRRSWVTSTTSGAIGFGVGFLLSR